MYSTPPNTTASTPISASLPGVTPACLATLDLLSTAHLPAGRGLVALETEIDHNRGLHRIVIGLRVDAHAQVFHLGKALNFREPLEERTNALKGAFAVEHDLHGCETAALDRLGRLEVSDHELFFVGDLTDVFQKA